MSHIFTSSSASSIRCWFVVNRRSLLKKVFYRVLVLLYYMLEQLLVILKQMVRISTKENE